MVDLVCSQLQFTRNGSRLIASSGVSIAVRERRGGCVEHAIRATALAAFDDQLWTIGERGLERWTLDGRLIDSPRRAIASHIEVGPIAAALAGPPAALWSGRLWLDDLGQLREHAAP